MKHLIYFFLATLLLAACEPGPKPNEPFYCKIDGKKFRPDNGGDIFLEALLAQRDEDNNLFYMTVLGKDSKSVSISAKFENLRDFREQRYEIDGIFKGNYVHGSYDIGGGITKAHLHKSFQSSGHIEFTKVDTVKQRVSGTFEFKAKSIYTNREVKVTNGSFNDVFFY